MGSIRYLIMDVDGTLTDGKIHIGNSGELYKTFNIKDGFGIHDIAIPHGIIPVIITGRISKILENRCRELGIAKLYQGVTDKVEIMNSILENQSYGIVAYIGDDINDITCMKLVHDAGGLVGCPSDAVRQILELADFVSVKTGGDGAVREFIDWIVGSNE